MNEQDVRALVREAIARQRAAEGSGAGMSAPFGFASDLREHASHRLFVVPSGADSDGPCIIEPAVACTHCGYCKSYGH